MAYIIGSGAIIEVVINQTLSGQTVLNVLHYLVVSGTATDGATAIGELLTIIGDTLTDSIIAAMGEATSEDLAFNTLTGQTLFPTRYRKVTMALNGTGNLTVPSGPAVFAATITKFNESSGRHNLGAFHLAGVPREKFLPSGMIDTAFAGDELDTLAFRLRQAISLIASGLELVPVIFNRSSPGISAQVTGTAVQPSARAMQRRVVGRGI